MPLSIEVDQDWSALRRDAYPPLADFADAVVKGDAAQLEQYVAACQAVKARFPKPEETEPHEQ